MEEQEKNMAYDYEFFKGQPISYGFFELIKTLHFSFFLCVSMLIRIPATIARRLWELLEELISWKGLVMLSPVLFQFLAIAFFGEKGKIPQEWLMVVQAFTGAGSMAYKGFQGYHHFQSQAGENSKNQVVR